MDIKPKASTDKHELHQQHQQQDILSSSVSSKNSARKISIWSAFFYKVTSLQNSYPQRHLQLHSTALNPVRRQRIQRTKHQTILTRIQKSRQMLRRLHQFQAPAAPTTCFWRQWDQELEEFDGAIAPQSCCSRIKRQLSYIFNDAGFKPRWRNSPARGLPVVRSIPLAATLVENTNLSKYLGQSRQRNRQSSLPQLKPEASITGGCGWCAWIFPHEDAAIAYWWANWSPLKFATEGARAFEEYGRKHGMTITVDKIALEGEGKVWSRVDSLYKRLLEYIELIDGADCVFFAAHSQGTPVAAHLLARLVEDGHVDGKTIGMVGMAGISLGPFSGQTRPLWCAHIFVNWKFFSWWTLSIPGPNQCPLAKVCRGSTDHYCA